MTGLVVVSHSRALADAAVALAAEMLHGRPVAIEVAAGLGDGSLGTDATAIAAAMEAAGADGDGVVVLMDLGSAVLSAELALELIPDPDRVVLCPGPLVEGLVAAAVAASSGAPPQEVAAEASAGLAGKQAHLGPPDEVVDTGGGQAAFTVTNPHGLHARPAARLVALVRDSGSTVELRNRTTGSAWVSAASLSKVATLGAAKGHEVEIRSPDRQTIDAIRALAAKGFGEEADRAGAPGIGIGPARQVRVVAPELADVPSGGTEQELDRLASALSTVRSQLRTLAHDGAGILDAHLALLDDAELPAEARARIEAGAAAPQAWSAAAGQAAAGFDALADPYLRERAADVRAVADQVLRALLGVPAAVTVRDGVLIAPDLTPADVAALDPAVVAGIVLAGGSPTAHSAILARARGIPAVVGRGSSVLDIPDGTTVALDSGRGELAVDPPEAVLADFQRRADAQASRHRTALSRADAPAVTRDGVPVAVGANVGSPQDARAAAANGADHAGLVRTEFLFLDRDTAPDVDEQVAAYRAVADALGGRRITLRTLDVGGDKPLRYLPAPVEANPFLGVRGLRHSLAHPALLRDQLRAIVAVARETPVSVMFPMVSTPAELLAARRLLDEATGGDPPAGLEVGIMVEVPATALKLAAFAPHLGFVSIGTNDLTQYALAAERGNPALAGLSDPLDPGVLRLIDATCRAAGDRVTVAVCGELAADEAAVPLLLALGVRELSVAPPAVPAVKEAVRASGSVGVRRALDLPDAAAVRALLG